MKWANGFSHAPRGAPSQGMPGQASGLTRSLSLWLTRTQGNRASLAASLSSGPGSGRRYSETVMSETRL